METVACGLSVDDLVERIKRTPTKAELKTGELMELCLRVREVFMMEQSVLDVAAPVNIIGDIHGQIEDLLRIFTQTGWPPHTRYVFLGDYVDRGKYSTEVIALLLCLKFKHGEEVSLLRGNHETLAISKVYGFHDECKRRFSTRLWRMFAEVFNAMPLCAVVANKIFCVHGGISQDLLSWNQLKRIIRPTDIPDAGILCDLLWADPDKTVKGYAMSQRGVSYLFGADAVQQFCKDLDVDLIVRAHQVMKDGYEFFANKKLITIFSAPNYCGEFDNAAGILHVNKDLLCSLSIHYPEDLRRTPLK